MSLAFVRVSQWPLVLHRHALDTTTVLVVNSSSVASRCHVDVFLHSSANIANILLGWSSDLYICYASHVFVVPLVSLLILLCWVCMKSQMRHFVLFFKFLKTSGDNCTYNLGMAFRRVDVGDLQVFDLHVFPKKRCFARTRCWGPNMMNCIKRV